MATTMKTTRTGCALLLAGLSLPPLLRAERSDPVAVYAAAEGQYEKNKFGDNGAKPRVETYVFAVGRHFGGLLRDASHEGAEFADITRVLARDLSRQGYSPAHEAKAADLLIVVHWGATTVEENAGTAQSDLDRTNRDADAHNTDFAKTGFGEIGSVYADLEAQKADAPVATNSVAFNALLLGYTCALRKEEYRSLGVPSGMTYEDRVLRDDLLEERYFVILMAYDLHAMKQGTRARPAWSIHFSTPAAGHSFETALPAMSQVAAKFFGRQLDGLILDARDGPAKPAPAK
jgi:hypothetical protein